MTFRIGERRNLSAAFRTEGHDLPRPLKSKRGFKRLHRYKPQTLFTRTLIMILMPLLLVQGVVAVVFYGQLWEVVSRRLCGAVAAQVATVTSSFERAKTSEEKLWVIDSASSSSGYQIYYRESGYFTPTAQNQITGILNQVMFRALENRLKHSFRLDLWNPTIFVEIDVKVDNGFLSFKVPREFIFTSASYGLFLWMAGTSAIFLVIAVLFLRNQMRPIRRLSVAAHSFGRGEEDIVLSPSGASEIRLATEAFISMRQQIRRFVTQRTEMLSAASHDLRTPLTRMRLELELLGSELDKQRLGDQFTELFAGLHADIVEMEHLINSYLEFLRGEGTELASHFDLSKLLEQVAQGAERNRLKITRAIQPEIRLMGRVTALKRVFDNLVSNAARHAQSLSLTAEEIDGRVVIWFDDDGEGIPESQREEVFKPFVRLEQSRNQQTGGFGLGLALARDVIFAHGGEISLLDSPLGGLRVEIILPMG
ncbi:MAG: ATP-binding protein [Candidatus Pacebacteria bacterium]|nr:ATP-binding protein [Candidatus Paceibacterota bacterium]